jgi:hypothetical protein
MEMSEVTQILEKIATAVEPTEVMLWCVNLNAVTSGMCFMVQCFVLSHDQPCPAEFEVQLGCSKKPRTMNRWCSKRFGVGCQANLQIWFVLVQCWQAEVTRLFYAMGPDFRKVVTAADQLRSRVKGERVSFFVESFGFTSNFVCSRHKFHNPWTYIQALLIVFLVLNLFCVSWSTVSLCRPLCCICNGGSPFWKFSFCVS